MGMSRSDLMKLRGGWPGWARPGTNWRSRPLPPAVPPKRRAVKQRDTARLDETGQGKASEG